LNFFESQDRARRNTGWLILLFILAVAGLVFLTNLLLLGILTYAKTNQFIFSLETLQTYYSWEEIAAVTIGVCLLIFCGSLYKTMSLSGGGATVAAMLGGRLVPRATTDLQQRPLLNVVEEMAIAAGMPIPKVYLLDDLSINAFAAGQSPANAVIGITSGTIPRLHLAEIQGIIAHEFSHIANGDMRLNIRLIGLLHGILLIGMIGYFLLRTMRFGRRSRSSKGSGGLAALVALGLGLIVIGYAGSFFGQWIKAVVSRQREYLADSSAVQFTRNSEGIAGALKKIGGAANVGSFIESPSAPQFSHAYFANGMSSFSQALLATHPPLEKRIRAIDARWDGKFLHSSVSETPAPEAEAPSPDISGMAVTAAILSSAEQAITQVGTLNEENIEYVHQLILALPVVLREASQDAFSARAMIYAVLINMQKDKTAAAAVVAQNTDPIMQGLSEKYLSELDKLEDKFRLPLLELSINALKELSPNQFIQFKQAVHEIIISDKSVNLNEWILQRFLMQQLDQYFGFRKPPKARHASLDAVKNEVESILSLIAYVEHRDDDGARIAFQSGARETGVDKLEMLPRKNFKLESLNQSLDSLMQLKPLVKPRLLKACVAIILQDGKTTTRGIELVRTISSCLDCPMPPIPI